MPGVHLKGQLVKGEDQPHASCLMWHPELGLSGSPLVHGLSGRIVYRDAPPPTPPRPLAPRAGRIIIRQAGGVVIQQIVRPDGHIVVRQFAPGAGPLDANLGEDGNVAQVPATGRRSLQLRNGEVVPG
jgi:hypothetical protein